jgi:hypothetical protein
VARRILSADARLRERVRRAHPGSELTYVLLRLPSRPVT